MSLFGKRDRAARFEALAQQHERMLYLLCLRMMGNPEDAQDCAQEALLRAFRAFDGFRGEANAKTWLYRIAYNACVDALRKRRGEFSLEALEEAGFDPEDRRLPRPEEALEKKEMRLRISQGLALLPPEQRAVMILRDFQQLSYDRIAQILELSEGTVKSRLNRAREKMKNYLMNAEQIDRIPVQENEGRQK